MSYPLFTYQARVVKVVDGDTIDVVLDAGFHSTRTERLRLLGVNAPEMHGPSHDDGQAAKDFTLKTLTSWGAFDTQSWPLLISTEKSDVFGRYLALVTPKSDPSVDLSNELYKSGHAVHFKG